MNKAKNIVVTISRQQASGGAYIGHLLAKNLGFRYMEQEILSLTAKELGVNLADLAHKEECCDGFVEKMMKSFMYGTPEAGYAAPVRKPVLDEDLFLTESRIIKTIANSYDAVIVGRGGYSILAGMRNALHVFVHASLEFRVDRLQKYNRISAAQARAEIEESDRRREKYLSTMTKTNWCDARNYHLCIDAEASGFDEAQRIIMDLVEKRKSDLEEEP